MKVSLKNLISPEPLLWFLAINVLVSIAHYIHNMVFLPEYHEPAWITPTLIDSLWFVMTPFGLVGYWLYCRGKLQAAKTSLFVYCALSSLVLGHYVITPIWTLSLTINLMIWAEAIAASILSVYVYSFPKPKNSDL
ncbi:MAG: hypothetical protein F6J87_01715 [Spirulina sp. SIO3F2]|nr:hypothetical protein [Spirulina sp. SIO3F2]